MSIDFTAAREQMTQEQLRQRGISDERVLEVMSEIPRELFVPEPSRPFAYEDRALPIECSQTISQPYIVALMTVLLDVQSHDRVLEVGTGSGYQTAILARLVETAYTIERISELRELAEQRLASLGISNVHFLQGDGTHGCPEHAPYDRIMVTAGSPRVPQPLVDQLGKGGRMVVPVGPTDRQTLTAVDRIGGRIIEQPSIGVRFVKLVGDHGWPAGDRSDDGLAPPVD